MDSGKRIYKNIGVTFFRYISAYHEPIEPTKLKNQKSEANNPPETRHKCWYDENHTKNHTKIIPQKMNTFGGHYIRIQMVRTTDGWCV